MAALVNKDVQQEQTQYVNVASPKHGMTDEVRCAYVDHCLPGMVAAVRRAMMMEKHVKVLFYEGEVRRVFCRHISGDACTSQLRKESPGKCFIVEPGA